MRNPGSPEPRSRWRTTTVVAAALAVVLGSAACDLAGTDTPAPSPTGVEGPPPVVLPGEGVLLPPGVAGGGGWVGTDSFPGTFDPDVAYDSPQALADAFANAIVQSFGVGAQHLQLALVLTDELDDGRVVLILSETGVADDSVAGTQYALVVTETIDGWVLDDLYARPLCTRGVAEGRCT